MATMLRWAVYSYLILWFIVCIVSQFLDRVGMHFPRMSAMGLIPCWTFFAPRPGMDDTHLLYRDKLGNAGLGKLTYVPTIEDRRWYHAVWNPQKIQNKVFSDLTSSLRSQVRMVMQEDRDVRIVMLSTPYIMMVNLAMQMPRSPAATARQFILARSNSFGSTPGREILFLSEFHRFESV